MLILLLSTISIAILLLLFCTIFTKKAFKTNPLEITEGESSSGSADFSKIIENLANDETQRTEPNRTPKITKFFREDPISFFVIVEATFRQARIHLESTKADYLIASLDHNLIPDIKHLILRCLLRGEVISKGKPSLLPTRLRALNDRNCTDNIIRSVFLEQMPSNMGAILTMANVESLQELANLSDRISEAAQPLNYQVAAVSSSHNILANTSAVTVPVVLSVVASMVAIINISALAKMLINVLSRVCGKSRPLQKTESA